MSAIAGVITLDHQPAALEQVSAMLDALAHRGDWPGTWCAGSAAVGCRSLHSNPESRSEARLAVHTGAGVVVVADARIDNRAELLAAFGPAVPASASDATLILHAYLRWGARCVEKLLGDFAFAAWDERTRSLFCARDPMGVKPLYIYRDGRFFAFATEVKGLFALKAVPREIDPLQIASYLDHGACEPGRTAFRGIDRLPAAHLLILDRSGERQSRYWTAANAPDLRLRGAAEYAEAFRQIFTDAVRVRLRGAGAVGSTLSGGLDSSSVVCVARQLAPRGLHTFSVTFPGLPEEELRRIDERRYVDAVHRGGGIQAHAVRGDLLTPLGDVRRMLWHLDEPFLPPNLYLHWAMYAAARQAGAGVLLDGFDGDAVVSHGLGRFNTLLREGSWDRFDREVRAFAARRGMRPDSVLRHYGLPYLGELARAGRWAAWRRAARELRARFGLGGLRVEYGLRPAMPGALRTAWRAVRPGRVESRSLLRPELARRLPPSDLEATTPSDREAQLMGLAQPLYPQTLEIADKSAAAFGVEPRYPFFDRRLVEFCVGVPEEHRFDDGWTRLTFRRAMEGILPPEVQWRSDKANLTPNFQRRLRADRDSLMERSPRLAEFVDLARLDRARDRFLAREPSVRPDPDAAMLFQAAALGTWFSQMDGRSADRPVPAAA